LTWSCVHDLETSAICFFACMDHPNVQVRLKAAKRTLAIATGDARDVLEAIANSRKFPQMGEAGMSLANLDSGLFEPR
jgi:hypothetical protein